MPREHVRQAVVCQVPIITSTVVNINADLLTPALRHVFIR